MDTSSAVNLPEIPQGLTLEGVWNWFLSMLPSLAKAALILLVGYIAIKVILRLVDRVVKRRNLSPSAYKFFSSVLKIVLWFLVLFTAGSSLGIELSSFLAIFSVAGIAVSLAVKDSLTDVAGGLQILITKPFGVGDFVDLDGTSGTVLEIGVVYTKLLTIDNRGIYIPNGQVTSSKIINASSEESRRLDLVVPIPYEADFERAIELLKGIVYAHPDSYKEPAPLIRLSEFGDSALEIAVRVWTEPVKVFPLKYDLLEEIKRTFDREGIPIAYPHLDVTLVK